MQTTGSERARATLSYLRRKITTGEWPVGIRIPIEPELAEQMGVGRSTVREAVRSLANMGMLETLPGRGTFVRSATPTSALLNEFLNAFTLEEILSYRRALEIEAAQQATIHRTDEDLAALEAAAAEEQGCSLCPIATAASSSPGFESKFHLLIFDAAKNRLLASLYAGINEQLRNPQHRGRLANIASASEMEHYHAQLLDAIRRKDFIDAVHAMAAHVDNDVVMVTPDQEVVPTLARSEELQQRIDGLQGELQQPENAE
ncbi:FadR family transcriptional regulator [Leucobacter sp. OH2974_COT-288]|uniref:DNA-binding FadR family transcriptional regulator n=1 Tax=Canibacter oris TaxID=1365628 RepID=A0A840DQ69_9MICO|nr:FCD domain-containing protein [Canibacter oris]MBB4072158.1 DNA-binding FadR family transcriptional regulator [Canibacter oris]RRD35787.1 FadR family transcriptional regulator [Leucobacter sp. OH2974_COT-288]